MPALLTAAIIVCGALREPGAPLACRAQVHHGIYADQPECAKATSQEAKRLEQSVVLGGELTRTRSHGECFYAADEGSIVFYLPEFMAVQLGADSSTVAEYDVVDGAPVMRAPDAFAKEL